MDRETETYQIRNAQVIAMVHAYVSQYQSTDLDAIGVLTGVNQT